MVTYDFVCKAKRCGAEFQLDLPMGTGQKPKCPECKSPNTQKVILGTPHIKLDWKAWDTNTHRPVIRASRAGKPSPKDGWVDPKEYQKVQRELRRAPEPA